MAQEPNPIALKPCGRDGQVVMIVTTNLRFADWTQVFGDERLTAALLDRLTHKAHILEFIGESYRFRQRMQRETHEEEQG